MRLTRVFVDAPLASGTRVALPAEAAAHLTRVLRLGAGDECIVFDGRGGEYAARLAKVDKRETLVDVGVHDPVDRESPLKVLLLQALARGEKMDLIVQKATELGVAAIRPVHTLHSGVRLDPHQAARKLAHWRGVAISACEQCRRNRIPQLLEPLPLPQALQEAPTGTRIVLSPGSGDAPATPLARLPSVDAGSWITLIVGPEGGLAPDEEAMLRAAECLPARIGPRVLRTETAALAALSVLGALAGDLG